MILDLKGEQQMEPIVGMLFSMVDGNYRRLKGVVAGMAHEGVKLKQM